MKGRLHLWQFFDFKGEKHLEPPNPIHLFREIPGETSQRHAFIGYLQLLDSIYTWLDLPEAKKQFRMRRTLDQQGMSELDKKVVSRTERATWKMEISSTKRLLKKWKRLWVKQVNQRVKSRSRDVFTDRELPEPYLGESSKGETDGVEDNPVVIDTGEVLKFKADYPISLTIGDDPPVLYPEGIKLKVSKVTLKGWSDHMKLE